MKWDTISGKDAMVYKGRLKMAKCGNAACTAGNSIAIVDTAMANGSFTSIALGGDGIPVIGYYGLVVPNPYGSGGLKVAKCYDAACSETAGIRPFFRSQRRNIRNFKPGMLPDGRGNFVDLRGRRLGAGRRPNASAGETQQIPPASPPAHTP